MSTGASDPRSSRPAIGFGARALVGDALELAELQLQLFSEDGRQYVRAITPLALTAVAGVVIALCGLPLLLAAVAAVLVEVAGFAAWFALLCAALIGFVIGGGLALIAGRKIGPQTAIWSRSTAELRANVEWLKANLDRPGEADDPALEENLDDDR